MDKKKLNELLDSIYELEGLVHLALSRDDNPAHLPQLIRLKGEELAERASEIVAPDTDTTEQPGVNDVAGQPNEEMAEESKTDTPLYVVDLNEGDENTDQPPVEEEMQSVVAAVFDSLPAEEEAELTKTDDKPVPPDAVLLGVVPDLEEKAVTNQSAPQKEPRGRLVFSINDRYLFKRELFKNSDADFNNTLSMVAAMENYEEAEDYFLGELQWDPKKNEVAAFLAIIKKYFK
ncbi:MAG: hypothetical protein HDR88_16035 [Bacteroides sp.]|nr:hypothetical protein [Bacteroides sp.]